MQASSGNAGIEPQTRREVSRLFAAEVLDLAVEKIKRT
jgi:hypothetical protein